MARGPDNGEVAYAIRNAMKAQPERSWRVADLAATIGRSASAVYTALDWMGDVQSSPPPDFSRGNVWRLAQPGDSTDSAEVRS